MSDFTYSFFLPINHDSLFLYKYQVQNTLPPRRISDTSAALRRVNRNIVVSRAEEEKEKKKAPFRRHLTRGDAVK